MSERQSRETQIARAPLAFLEACRDHYRATVRDYRCLFRKRGGAGGDLSADEHIRVLFRETPFSVDMKWIENARRAARLTYVEGRWIQNGKKMAHIMPAGIWGLLVPRGVKRDIYGKDMARDSQRPIDQFGYDQTLRAIIETCRRASGRQSYRLSLVGLESFYGRSCYHLQRRLPFTPGSSEFPNRLLDIFIDCEWLVPIGCLGYADDARETLLGSYLLLDPEFNVGLTEDDFQPR